MMQVGRAMGVRTFITEAGHYHSDKPAPPVPYDFQEPVWKQMVATGKELAQLAERNDAVVLFEAFYRGFLASAKRTRMFLEEVGSPRIRALLDAANLLEINDLEEMFQQLHPWIDCLHAKDRKRHVDRGVAGGPRRFRLSGVRTLAAKMCPACAVGLGIRGHADLQAGTGPPSRRLGPVRLGRRNKGGSFVSDKYRQSPWWSWRHSVVLALAAARNPRRRAARRKARRRNSRWTWAKASSWRWS